MKTSNIISKATLIVSLTLLLALWPMFFIIIFPGFWPPIQKMSGVSIGNVLDSDRDIASFIRGQDAELDFLTEQEISHLKDVRTLFTATSITLLFSAALLVISKSYLHRRSAKSILIRTSIGVILFLIFLIILTFLNFQWLFIKFHEAFFAGNYAFPFDSMLKILYPDGFFSLIFAFYFLLAVFGCLIAILMSRMLKV